MRFPCKCLHLPCVGQIKRVAALCNFVFACSVCVGGVEGRAAYLAGNGGGGNANMLGGGALYPLEYCWP